MGSFVYFTIGIPAAQSSHGFYLEQARHRGVLMHLQKAGFGPVNQIAMQSIPTNLCTHTRDISIAILPDYHYRAKFKQ